jgi:hypothetical protein
MRATGRTRLICLAERHPDWVLGYQDEVWWSRLARPDPHAWSGSEPMRLHQRPADAEDREPKALACYGLLRGDTGGMLLRFVDGRPVSQVTEEFLAWACERLASEGKRALLLIWGNASWHASARVRAWIQVHNRRVKREGGSWPAGCRSRRRGSTRSSRSGSTASARSSSRSWKCARKASLQMGFSLSGCHSRSTRLSRTAERMT